MNKKYMVRLVDNYHNDLKFQLALQDVMVIHFDRVLPNFIIIQTDKELEELRLNPLFKSVERERIGTLDV